MMRYILKRYENQLTKNKFDSVPCEKEVSSFIYIYIYYSTQAPINNTFLRLRDDTVTA